MLAIQATKYIISTPADPDALNVIILMSLILIKFFESQATYSSGYEQQAIDVSRQTIFLIWTYFYLGLYRAISCNLAYTM
jgi:hypothetical protein